MFQFRRFPAYTYLFQCTLIRYCRIGFPHSEISGSKTICVSPKLIAACHVLRRLLMPRHSPCALFSLTYGLLVLLAFRIMQATSQKFCLKLFYPNSILKFHIFCFVRYIHSVTPSVALLLHSSLCSVFKVQMRFSSDPKVFGVPSKLNNVRHRRKD